MNNYKENIWYGWNGGECPVHPETIAQIMFSDGSTVERHPARFWGWEAENELPIVAFKVLKEYKEPREFWIGNDLFLGLPDISTEPRLGYIHVREVI